MILILRELGPLAGEVLREYGGLEHTTVSLFQVSGLGWIRLLQEAGVRLTPSGEPTEFRIKDPSPALLQLVKELWALRDLVNIHKEEER